MANNKICVICDGDWNQEEIVESEYGYAHRDCLDEQALDQAEESEENNEKLL